MRLFTTIEQFITKHNLIQQNNTIVIGLSGGPDSVFLLHILVSLQFQYNLTLIAAHLNHEWRPESGQEEQLCASIAQQHNIKFISAKLSELPHKPKYNGSKEEYARAMRRFFLENVAREYNANCIALGHHAQDQQETFFLRLIRGSSLTGLTAMKPHASPYIRPLLEINKQEILAWLSNNNITYAIDSSNESDLFLRNRIRATLLPAVQSCDARFNDNFLKTINRLKETETFMENAARNAFQNISYTKNGTTGIDTALLAATDKALHHRIIIHWLITNNLPFPTTQTFFDETLRFLLSPRGGSHAVHPKWSITKNQQLASILLC